MVFWFRLAGAVDPPESIQNDNVRLKQRCENILKQGPINEIACCAREYTERTRANGSSAKIFRFNEASGILIGQMERERACSSLEKVGDYGEDLRGFPWPDSTKHERSSTVYAKRSQIWNSRVPLLCS